jgi:hypothetical protein
MNGSILEARLIALEINLNKAANANSWRRRLELQNVDPDEMVWNRISKLIETKVQEQRLELQRAREAATKAAAAQDRERGEELQKAWRKYGRAYDESQKIFHECLEILVGLALRDKLLDEVCHIADELIKESATMSLGSNSLAVPAADEALDKTLARIVRVRFPDWSVWTLPSVVHEYAHVLIDENEGLRDFIAANAAALLAQDEKLQQAYDVAGDEDQELIKRRATYPLRVLVADAFATYALGPAYASAAILLRLDPLVAGRTGGRPAHTRRAHVILTILDYIDGKQPRRPYKQTHDELDAQWRSLVAVAGVELPAAEAGSIEQLAADLGPTLDTLFEIPDVGMPYPFLLEEGFQGTTETGWSVAERWANQWGVEIGNAAGGPIELTVPEVADKSKLRDVINAAWLSVLDLPDRRDEIAKVAQATCEAILAQRRQGPPPSRGQYGRKKPRPSR